MKHSGPEGHPEHLKTSLRRVVWAQAQLFAGLRGGPRHGLNNQALSLRGEARPSVTLLDILHTMNPSRARPRGLQ